jgi:phage baseplate assembly protein W
MDVTRKRIVGFSTASGPQGEKPNWTLYDKEIAKQDLLNHFYTRKGERVMMPDFGCVIWDKIMEPFTPGVRDMIVWDARNIVESDSRFNIIEINVTEYQYGIKIDMVLQYNPDQSVEQFVLDFDKRMMERGSV